MSQNYEKLKTLLQELFQLDQPDLDFGLYRVMHAKSAEVSQFLEKDLLPQVQTAFGQYKTADKTEIEKELAKVIAGIEAAGMDPAQSPKVNDLRARLKSDAVDVGALESEVYDHLFSFFRRYYSEGDFLAQLEDFQKKLWLKKKFVVETQYCITLDRIPEEFYPEIAANDAQWAEWEGLHSFQSSVFSLVASSLKTANRKLKTSSRRTRH